MGLDMYLLAKTKKPVGKNPTTGACNGLFGLTIATEEDEQEIGYWRKEYRLSHKLESLLFAEDEEDNLVPKEMTEKQIEEVIAFAQAELEAKDYEDGFYSDDDWKYTIEVFQKALELAKQGVKIIYEQWY